MASILPAGAQLPVPIVRKQFRLDDLFSDTSESSAEDIEPEYLSQQARWIREDLDPQIAQEGPASLKPDSVVAVFKLLDQLRRTRVSIETIRSSRIHLAVACIAGPASRWPGSVIDLADKLLENWSTRYGEVSEIGILLYEEGGRLHGICTAADISKEVLEVKWRKATGSKTYEGYSHRHGDLNFKPGEWWINTMFAYHAGIIDNGVPTSRIIHDKHGAYALLLNEWDESDSPSPSLFTYKAKSNEPGRYRLTAATPDSRQPVRVLRSHALRSFWAPKAGIRYDGLYRDIQFKRLASEAPMSEVLRHPFAEEVDDYMEYKRIRNLNRQDHNAFRRARPLLDQPVPRAEQTLPHQAVAKLALPPQVPGAFETVATAPPTPPVVEARPTLPPLPTLVLPHRKNLSTRPVPKSRLRIELPPAADVPAQTAEPTAHAAAVPPGMVPATPSPGPAVLPVPKAQRPNLAGRVGQAGKARKQLTVAIGTPKRAVGPAREENGEGAYFDFGMGRL